jgi:hypothetical protein
MTLLFIAPESAGARWTNVSACLVIKALGDSLGINHHRIVRDPVGQNATFLLLSLPLTATGTSPSLGIRPGAACSWVESDTKITKSFVYRHEWYGEGQPCLLAS